MDLRDLGSQLCAEIPLLPAYGGHAPARLTVALSSGTASVAWGVPYLFVKLALVSFDPLFTVFARAAVAAVVLLPFAARRGLLACVALYALITRVGAGRALVITYIAPVISVGCGVAFLHEGLGPGAVAGMLLILAGSWLSTGGRPPSGLLRHRTSRIDTEASARGSLAGAIRFDP